MVGYDASKDAVEGMGPTKTVQTGRRDAAEVQDQHTGRQQNQGASLWYQNACSQDGLGDEPREVGGARW